MSNLRKFIKTTIREFLNENTQHNDIGSVFQYFMNKNLNYEHQENLENSYDELNSLISGDKIIAYRVLNVNDVKDIDINNIGIHFTTDKQNTTSDDFLEKIGVIDFEGNYDNEKFFVITVETNVNNVDWYKTFDNRINYYGEDEINFINSNQLKIINIEEIEL
jgi:translation elongation factor EF-1alpha